MLASRVEERYAPLFHATIDRSMQQTRPYPVVPGRAHDTPPRYGVFELHCDNSKRRAGKPVQFVTCYGARYPGGAVQLHSNALGILDFLSWQQFTDHLDALGQYRVVWLALPVSSSEVGQ